MKKDTQQFLADRYTEKWLEENKGMMEDYQEICHQILLFHANWGMNIGVVFNSPEKNEGRGLGVGMTEELFDAQDFTKNVHPPR